MTATSELPRCYPEKPYYPSAPCGGRKDDAGKLRLELVPAEFIEWIAKVLQHGAEKYGEGNWQQGFDVKRLKGAFLRHYYAFEKGELIDPDSGLPHIDQAAVNALFISWYTKHPQNTVEKKHCITCEYHDVNGQSAKCFGCQLCGTYANYKPKQSQQPVEKKTEQLIGQCKHGDIPCDGKAFVCNLFEPKRVHDLPNFTCSNFKKPKQETVPQ